LGPNGVVDLGHGLFRLGRSRFGTAYLMFGIGELILHSDGARLGALQLAFCLLQPRAEPCRRVFGACARCLGIVDARLRLPKPFECRFGQCPGSGLSLRRPLLESPDDARHLNVVQFSADTTQQRTSKTEIGFYLITYQRDALALVGEVVA
jgi:hypothetical protein